MNHAQQNSYGKQTVLHTTGSSSSFFDPLVHSFKCLHQQQQQVQVNKRKMRLVIRHLPSA
jgi:hypothetical protein